MRRIGKNDGIAPWKIDNSIERYLSRKADCSDHWKRIYVAFYRLFDKEYYNKGLKFIDDTLRLFIKKELSQTQKKEYTIDMVYSLHRFGCAFDEYFLYHFPLLNTKGRESFVTDKIRYGLYKQINRGMDNALFDNKALSFQEYREYYQREIIEVKGKQDEIKIQRFIEKHGEAIIKPLDDSCGRGVRSIKEEDITVLLDQLKKPLLCEEKIRQSKTLEVLHPQSVNMVRMTTISTKKGICLFHPLLRVGVGSSIIDNAAAGGVFALVDEKTGIIKTEAKDEKGNTYCVHPDTGVAFPGFQLPDWGEAVSLVYECAKRAKGYHYVAWDLAHTDHGWIIVEGNAKGQVVMMQTFYNEGFKHELEEAIREI